MNYLYLIIFAFLPSFIWLLFYLRKDAHPESNSMILKVFFLGMFSTIPTVFVQLFFFKLICSESITSSINLCHSDCQSACCSAFNCFFYVFIGIAFTEEFFKYLVVRFFVLRNSEFDEPLDLMLYMIISALGFAAIENLALFLPVQRTFEQNLIIMILRFISATFLHALLSGTLGYFIALGIKEIKKRNIFLLIGFFIVTLLHGFYNFYIMKEEMYSMVLIPALIIINLAILVSFLFNRIKKIPSICKI